MGWARRSKSDFATRKSKLETRTPKSNFGPSFEFRVSNMRSILVTGATGFQGKHLVEQLKTAEPTARLRVLCRGASPWDSDKAVEPCRGAVAARDDDFR